MSVAKLPVVAIIGRPNTGKSTLFNRIVGKRRAIVSSVPGTTRDHVVHKIERDEADYLLLDTGGIGGGSSDTDFEDDVSSQTVIAIESADLIIFTVNSRDELTASDFAIVDILRKRKRRHVPVVIVATKCDNFTEAEDHMHQYYGLGVSDEVLPISSLHRIGTDELEDLIAEKLKEMHFVKEPSVTPSETDMPRIAIVGRPNVGKSSIVNAFMSDPQRDINSRIVSDIPGTTRDSSDSIIKYEGRDYVFVDTAGLRRKSRVEEDLEFLSTVKSMQAVEDCDIVVLVLDASDVVSKQDKRIAGLAIEEGKGLIIVLNKSDLLKGAEKTEKEEETRASFPFCRFAPVIFVSALNRDGLLKLFPLIDTVHRNRMRRIPTKDLLRWYEDAVQRIPAQELARGKYITQADELPPTFVLFVRNPKNVEVSQLRYLENNIRDTFAFEGVPIRWVTKER